MDESTLTALRDELREDRSHQLEFLEQHGAEPYGDAVQDLQVDDQGFADAGQVTEERSEVLGHIDAARVRLQQIDEALACMDEGRYGTCVSCGEAIAPARLEARPLSVRCVDCADQDR